MRETDPVAAVGVGAHPARLAAEHGVPRRGGDRGGLPSRPTITSATLGRRALIRVEIDALMFHLYGVSRDDADYIMDTFPILRRKDEEAHGEYRTKRLVLDRYDAITAAFEATHRTLAATPNGARPPLDQPSLTTYSRLLADALDDNYQTNVDPPPAHPSQAHLASTRPSWADSILNVPGRSTDIFHSERTIR